MKFRQFEFKLFPKLRSRKKKKPKVCHSDFPRDIGRDKNFNFSKSNLYGYYDNLAADDGFSEFISDENDTHDGRCQSTRFDNGWNSSFPFQELKIQVENLYGCSQCTDDMEHSTSTFPLMRIDTPEVNNGSNTSSTIPRARTRIKTNPWLPSPSTTPSPSPTSKYGTVNSILYTPYLTRAEIRPRARNICKSERGKYPDYHSFLSVDDYVPLSDNGVTFQGLVKIVEQDNNENNITSGNDLITHKPFNRKQLLNNLTLNLQENSNSLSDKPKRFSYTKFLEYDTECSSLNSPNLENFDFLNNVRYEIDFGYEEDSDERLENSDLPHGDTFRSVNEILLDESAQVDINSSKHSIVSDLCSNMLIKNKTDAMKKNNSDISGMSFHADDKEITSPSNMDFNFYEDGNMQESIDTGYASVTRDSDSMSSDDEDDLYLTEFDRSRDFIDVNKQGDLDLEWDDDPTTQNLFLDFNFEHSSTTQSVQRNSSRSKTECQCQFKRSRSLADIELSLDEKVTQLRQEKVYVQKKVREAVEEDQIRRQQLCLFRSVSPSNKKHVLLSTLRDLKSRLEHQSVRLQASYDTVLTLQRRLSQKREKLLPVLETNI